MIPRRLRVADVLRAHWAEYDRTRVLQHFAADPQWRLEGQLGFLAVLHTWTQ